MADQPYIPLQRPSAVVSASPAEPYIPLQRPTGPPDYTPNQRPPPPSNKRPNIYDDDYNPGTSTSSKKPRTKRKQPPKDATQGPLDPYTNQHGAFWISESEDEDGMEGGGGLDYEGAREVRGFARGLPDDPMEYLKMVRRETRAGPAFVVAKWPAPELQSTAETTNDDTNTTINGSRSRDARALPSKEWRTTILDSFLTLATSFHSPPHPSSPTTTPISWPTTKFLWKSFLQNPLNTPTPPLLHSFSHAQSLLLLRYMGVTWVEVGMSEEMCMWLWALLVKVWVGRGVLGGEEVSELRGLCRRCWRVREAAGVEKEVVVFTEDKEDGKEDGQADKMEDEEAKAENVPTITAENTDENDQVAITSVEEVPPPTVPANDEAPLLRADIRAAIDTCILIISEISREYTQVYCKSGGIEEVYKHSPGYIIKIRYRRQR
ncbi:hypothetical protein G7K_4414-t1 [Saitoella complicata NRRL Y-17804]|uniref:Uncharacterized protein n=1 Tax=Saitoella complicata (strain BCRC 22490 / CBS 7301 / JCM 7358 / NBRC 10748 / NRRL Y-17804) TaxID=698492 RepID=A0A0E9NKB6_SAICN|nr:hypothetical protein G7K_4414-t1 [Saitoella complicata NRRL Y-17804]